MKQISTVAGETYVSLLLACIHIFIYIAMYRVLCVTQSKAPESHVPLLDFSKPY